MNERDVRNQIVEVGKSLFDRGLTFGSAGNISLKIDDGFLMTPTNSCLGKLDPDSLSKLDFNGNLLSGSPPTKEQFLHSAFYRQRNEIGAVVHTHSTYSVAVSCLSDVDPHRPIPPITPYFVMRVGPLMVLPYFAPGDASLAEAVEDAAKTHTSLLLANHGPVIAGKSLENAVYALEELEETAKLFFILKNMNTRFLDAGHVNELDKRFPKS